MARKTGSGGKTAAKAKKAIDNIKTGSGIKIKTHSSTSSSGTVKPVRTKQRKLDPVREQLAVMVNEANARAAKLQESGLLSRALREAQRTVVSVHRDQDVLFTSDLPRTRDINREFARVQTFLTDYTSLAEGAENFTSDYESIASSFGGQWRKIYGESYDTSRISKDDASRTFDLYDRIIEQGGGWERVVGMFRQSGSRVDFGSDVLIAAIYDMIDNNFTDEQIITRAMSLVNQQISEYERISELQRSNVDYGQTGVDTDNEARKNWYTRIRPEKKREAQEWRAKK